MLTIERHGRGALLERDVRDDAYNLGRFLSPVRAQEAPRSREWRLGPVRDQGTSSKCVGYSSRGLLDAGPIFNRNPAPNERQIYTEAQKRDSWPGEEPTYYGTSVRAAMSYLRDIGLVSGYAWAQGYEDLSLWIRAHSPLVLATRWTEGMFRPDWRGHVHPRGANVGGHAYLVYGITRWGSLMCRNSWGSDWGKSGNFFISRSNFETLSRMGYWEAATATEIVRQ